MDKLLRKFILIFFTKEFILFIMIGIVNTLNGTVFALIYSIFFNENIAFMIGYISALIVSYILNSIITFKERLKIKKFLKFAISYIPNFIIQNVVVLIVFNIMGLHKIIAYSLAAIMGIPITFILMKLFTFNNRLE